MTSETEKMPERIWAYNGTVNYSQGWSIYGDHPEREHNKSVEYIRRDAAYPVTKEVALEALHAINGGSVYIDLPFRRGPVVRQTIIALLEAAAK